MELIDFPILDVDYLKNLTVGIYQIKLAASYIQDTFERDNDEELHIELLRDQNLLPQPGLLRVGVFSWFRNAVKYQLWIAYLPNGDNEKDDEINGEPSTIPSPIQGHYCTCKAGALTLGTCAHISSVLWYLGYARHQENIQYPSTRLLESVQDAANRPLPRNDLR